MKNRREISEYFRASVGGMLTNSQGQILVLRRVDVAGEAWQLPQGGIQKGEEPIDAIRRELHEEIGISPEEFTVIATCQEWLAYELPKQCRSDKVGRGQVQKWFLCELVGDSVEIKPDGNEFDAYAWVGEEELLRRAASFRRPIYGRLLREFNAHLRALVQRSRAQS